MRRVIRLPVQFVRYMLTHQLIRFLVVGGVNTVFGYTCFSGLVFLGMPYRLASLFAMIAGVAFNFFTYSLFVFHVAGQPVSERHKSSLKLGKIMRYLSVYAVIYVINVLGLDELIRDAGVSPYLAQLLCLPVIVIISYFGNKYVAFK